MYAGARLLEYLSKQADINATLHGLPDMLNTPELNIKMAEGEHYALMDTLQKTARFPDAQEIITLDGLRVEYADGFGLARPSNTTPVIVLRFEAEKRRGAGTDPGRLPPRDSPGRAQPHAAVLNACRARSTR